MKIATIILFFVLILPSNAWAYDNKLEYFVLASVSCGKWIKAAENNNHSPYDWYVMGYLTAFNSRVKGIFNIAEGLDMPSIYLWLDKYCHENPLLFIYSGLSKFVEDREIELKRKK